MLTSTLGQKCRKEGLAMWVVQVYTVKHAYPIYMDQCMTVSPLYQVKPYDLSGIRTGTQLEQKREVTLGRASFMHHDLHACWLWQCKLFCSMLCVSGVHFAFTCQGTHDTLCFLVSTGY